ncbi:DUF1330 domain-containing protein [Bradyrhizobium sp.]|uniref:DUF1330 domain-containing protein n=1 Tax=Bradyrhizobium sp. TaxID=376 RepID=UPI0039C8A1BC
MSSLQGRRPSGRALRAAYGGFRSPFGSSPSVTIPDAKRKQRRTFRRSPALSEFRRWPVPVDNAAASVRHPRRVSHRVTALRCNCFWETTDAGLCSWTSLDHGHDQVRGVQDQIGPMVAKFGGRHLTRGDNLKMPEGGYWTPERVVVIEFPNMAAINSWYGSPEYQPLIELRKACQSVNDLTFSWTEYKRKIVGRP